MKSKKLTTFFSLNIAIVSIATMLIITLWGKGLLDSTIRQQLIEHFDYHAKLMSMVLSDESKRVESILQNIEVPESVSQKVEQGKLQDAREMFLKKLPVDIWEKLDVLILVASKNKNWLNVSAPIPETSSVALSIIESAKSMRNENRVLQIFDGENFLTLDLTVRDYARKSGRRGGKVIGGTVLNNNIVFLERLRKIAGVSKIGMTFKKSLISSIGLSEQEQEFVNSNIHNDRFYRELRSDEGRKIILMFKRVKKPSTLSAFGIVVVEKIEALSQGTNLLYSIIIFALILLLVIIDILWVRKTLCSSIKKFAEYTKSLADSDNVDDMNEGEIREFNEIARDVKELAAKLQDVRKESAGSHRQLNKIMKELNNSRRSLEEMVEHQARELKESVAMKQMAQDANAAKSELLAVISHELKTPLHAIISFSRYGIDDMQDEDFDKTEIIKNFEDINDAGNLLLEFVNDLLDLARLEAKAISYRMEQSDLLESVMNVVRSLKKLAVSRGLEIVLNYEGKSFEAIFDSRRIQQVVRNLLSNAIKFSNEHSIVEIELSKPIIHDSKVLQVSIKNTGVAISKEDMARIFDSFFQADTSSKISTYGTGLGLAICKQIVEDHDGKIFVQSNAEGMTTFSFIMPLSGQFAVG